MSRVAVTLSAVLNAPPMLRVAPQAIGGHAGKQSGQPWRSVQHQRSTSCADTSTDHQHTGGASRRAASCQPVHTESGQLSPGCLAKRNPRSGAGHRPRRLLAYVGVGLTRIPLSGSRLADIVPLGRRCAAGLSNIRRVHSKPLWQRR